MEDPEWLKIHAKLSIMVTENVKKIKPWPMLFAPEVDLEIYAQIQRSLWANGQVAETMRNQEQDAQEDGLLLAAVELPIGETRKTVSIETKTVHVWHNSEVIGRFQAKEIHQVQEEVFRLMLFAINLKKLMVSTLLGQDMHQEEMMAKLMSHAKEDIN